MKDYKYTDPEVLTAEDIVESIIQVAAHADREHFKIEHMTISKKLYDILADDKTLLVYVHTPYGRITVNMLYEPPDFTEETKE